jgi:hypothetical protein
MASMMKGQFLAGRGFLLPCCIHTDCRFHPVLCLIEYYIFGLDVRWSQLEGHPEVKSTWSCTTTSPYVLYSMFHPAYVIMLNDNVKVDCRGVLEN